MNFLDGIQNFLKYINDNWTSIMVCIGLIVGIYQKANHYLCKSNAEKISIAKAQIKETILKMISEAEITYGDWNKSGSIKRSHVINEIYDKYPILEKVSDQKNLVSWLDAEIDESLKTLRNTIEQ